MPVPQKICHPTIVVLVFFCHLIAGGLMVFSAVLMVSSFEALGQNKVEQEKT